jgi:hypothetical protein
VNPKAVKFFAIFFRRARVSTGRKSGAAAIRRAGKMKNRIEWKTMPGGKQASQRAAAP